MKVLDMHCDTITRLLTIEEEGKENHLLENKLHIDLKKMKRGEYLLQNFAIFTPLGHVEEPMYYCLKAIDKYYRELDQNKEWIAPVYSYEDILQNEKNGKCSAMLTLEEGAVVHNDLAMLRNYYRMGVRMIALTWNYENGIGFPNFTYREGMKEEELLKQINEKDGLTEFGIAYVKEMERLGIIVDVSHLSDKGFWDVLKHTTKPFVASHSNARSICGVARNLSDEMIKALAERGGVTGINFCKDFVSESGSVEDMVRHIKHIKEVGGIDVIGLGSDFDGIPNRKELKDASEIHLLEETLYRHGFTKEEVEKIFYRNVLRVYEEVLK